VDQKYRDLLSELRYAIDKACGQSERVIAAIVALQQAGQGVVISIETALVDRGVPSGPSPVVARGQPACGGLLVLNATDKLFLRL
jgi:hypothetical protein